MRILHAAPTSCRVSFLSSTLDVSTLTSESRGVLNANKQGSVVGGMFPRLVDVAAGAPLPSSPVKVTCHRSHGHGGTAARCAFPLFGVLPTLAMLAQRRDALVPLWRRPAGPHGATALRSPLSRAASLASTHPVPARPVSTRRAFICLATSPLARLSLSRAAVAGQDSQRRGTFVHSVPLRHWPMWRPAPHTHLSSRRRCPGWRSAAALLLSRVAVAPRSGSALSPIPRRCSCPGSFSGAARCCRPVAGQDGAAAWRSVHSRAAVATGWSGATARRAHLSCRCRWSGWRSVRRHVPPSSLSPLLARMAQQRAWHHRRWATWRRSAVLSPRVTPPSLARMASGVVQCSLLCRRCRWP